MIYYLRIGVLSENIRVPQTCSFTAMIGTHRTGINNYSDGNPTPLIGFAWR